MKLTMATQETPQQADVDIYQYWNRLGHTAYKDNKIPQAMDCFESALKAIPGDASALVNLANCLRRLQRYDEAIQCLRQAQLSGSKKAFVETNLANALHDIGRYQEALAYYARAQKALPENYYIAWNRSQTLLTLGRFSEAWPGYAKGIAAGVRKDYVGPRDIYQGERWPSGAVFVYKEQGLGDQILFSSCFADIERNTTDVTIQCDARLLSLFSRSFKKIKFVTEFEEKKMDNSQGKFVIPMGDVPSYFRKSENDFPKKPTSLSVCKQRKMYWKALVENVKTPIVGISWRGGMLEDDINKRKIDLPTIITSLINIPVSILILQHGITDEEHTYLKEMQSYGVIYPCEKETGNDVEDLAAMISICDVVVSVGNTVLNLSGALNAKAIGLLPLSTSWRWGTKAVTPWYPSTYCIRQNMAGSWESVLKEMIRRLRNELEHISEQENVESEI